MWEAGLQAYDKAKGIDWTWQAVDGAMIKATFVPGQGIRLSDHSETSGRAGIRSSFAFAR